MHPFSFAVVLLIVVSTVFAQDAARFGCKDGKFGPTDATKGKLKACHELPEYGTGDGKKDPKCLAFCFTEAIRGLKGGLPDKAAFEQIIDSEFPEASKKTSKDLLGGCFEKHGNIDLKDEKCVSIAAFSACATSLVKLADCA